MEQLTLVGLSDDRSRLLLVTDNGTEFSLPVDKQLRAALRGEHSRPGQLEIDMDSTLRPRDIQARIRAGESPEAVAQAAQTTVEELMPYAGPVLAERAHVADRAQRASVRRKSGDAGARTLGEAVAAHLRPLNISEDSIEWDSWRREDGRWILTGAFTVASRTGTAQFVFDAPGNYVTADNEDARWLVGDPSAKSNTTSSQSKAPTPRDEVSRARQRRMSGVDTEELPLGDDALEMISDEAPEPEPVLEAPREAEPEPVLEAPHEADVEPEVDSTESSDSPGAPEGDPESTPAEGSAEESPPARSSRKRKGRASVPSWDEIMFGGKPE